MDMIGGGIAKAIEKSIMNEKKMGKMMGGSVVLLVIFVYLMKVFIVKWAYNKIMPKLIVNHGNDINNFSPLTTMEAATLVLLFQFIMH